MAVPEDDYALVAFELFMLFGAVRGVFLLSDIYLRSL